MLNKLYISLIKFDGNIFKTALSRKHARIILTTLYTTLL